MESRRDRLGELFGLADSLQHWAALLRREAQEVVADTVDFLDSRSASLAGQPDRSAAETEMDKARDELEKNWLDADQRIEELVSEAAGEIARFTELAEHRMDALERRLRHDRARQALEDKHGEH